MAKIIQQIGKPIKSAWSFFDIGKRWQEWKYSFLARYKSSPADFWHGCLFASFWISLAIFPIGYGAREAMPLLCLLFLIPYYCHNWKDCVLRRLGPVWLFYCVAIMVALGIAFSINPWASFLHAGANFSKAFILTGSLGDYSVGNYLALALVPAFSVWYILRDRMDAWATSFLMLALYWPPLFLFQGASSRSALLAVAGAFALWAFMRHGLKNLRILFWPILVIAAFMSFQGIRLMPSGIVNDNRWDLWSLAWKIFWEHPWFGAGAGQYNPAFRSLGLAPEREVITISHPHDLYLDILYAHGIIGFCLGMVFIFGFLYWGWKNIQPHIRQAGTNPNKNLYWTLCAWFWLGYAAWLINGIFGHDFYRIWWLALAMCNMGIMIGAVVNGKNLSWQ